MWHKKQKQKKKTINDKSECSKLGQREYKTRHDWVEKVIHWEFCKVLKFGRTTNVTYRNVYEYIRERCLWVRFYSPNSALCVLVVFLGWLSRWEVGGRTAAVLWCIASKQHSCVVSISINFVRIHVVVVHSYGCIDTAKAWEKFCFILSDRSDFHMIDNLWIAVHIFFRCMLTSLSVDEIFLPRCCCCCRDVAGLQILEACHVDWRSPLLV